MFEKVAEFLSDPVALTIGIAAIIFSLWAWVYIWRSSAHIIIKVAGSFIPLIPILGPVLVIFIFGMPDKQDKSLQATMNHYGRGGKFIGFGSNRYNYTDLPEEDSEK